ncbi:MAG: nucleoside phosphorylase [bacterium]|nr:nucleoside phosphorylase [bacterium]
MECERPDFPILEFDDAPEAVIEPGIQIEPIADMPEHGVPCFFDDVIRVLYERGLLRQISTRRSEMGEVPVYVFDVNDRPVALFLACVGAPLAAAMLEEVIALGCRKFVACGGAGVLDSAIAMGHVLVPATAVRDEGTSYHYLPPSREIEAHPEAIAAIERTLSKYQIEFLRTKTWTTDGVYRETKQRIARRRDEGCLAVEMEAAALFAVAQFRGVPLGHILYGGDDVSGDEWDHRGWQDHETLRERLVWLAAEACLGIGKTSGEGVPGDGV